MPMAAIEPPDLTAFDPSAERAWAVSARMGQRLADSLRYIVDQADGHLPVPRAAMDGFLARLAAGPVPPLVFGAYCDLVLALGANELDDAARLLREIADAPNAPGGPLIVDLGDPQADAMANRYRRLVDTDPTMPFTIWPPPADSARRARALIGETMRLLDRGNPALAAEIRILLQEIVLAAGKVEAAASDFDGVSSFMLWGAIVLNVEAHKTVLDMVQAVAHESAHNLLFGLCADGPLHVDDETELHASPLRIDPRPMDGIIHATYVTARMHQAVQRLIEAGVLDDARRDDAGRANELNVKRFAMGLETVDRHAHLTPLGRAVRDGAVRYMAAYL